MKKYSVVFITALILSLILTACTTTEPTANDTPDTPKYGNMYRIGAIGEPTTFCPVFSTDARSSFIINLMFDSLLDTDENLEIKSQIADSWEFSDDGLEITFHLRDDVYFHDGEKLNADDVEYTYNVVLHDDYTGVRKEDLKFVDRVEAPDERTFKIYMKKPDAALMFSVASSSFGIMPKHIFDGTPIAEIKEHENSWNPIGTGPYKFKEYTSGQRIVLEANDDYYDGAPAIKTIVEKMYQDTQVMLAAFENGDLDYYGNIPSDDIDRVKEALKDTMEFKRTPALRYNYIGLKQTHPIFKDKTVRHAMMHALDRKTIIDTIFRGYGTMINSAGVPFQWSYSPKAKLYDGGSEEAIRLLEEAGWAQVGDDGIRVNDKGDRFSFTLVTGSGNEQRSNMLAMIKQQWKEVGIEVEIEEMELSVLFEKYLDAFNFEAYFWGWNLGLDPDCSSMFHSSSGRDENGNPAGFNDVEIYNDELDALLDKGRAVYDIEERKVIYHKVQELLNEELPYLFLYTTDIVQGMHNRIESDVWSPLGPIWIHKWSINE